MSFEVILRQLAQGFGQTCLIFILTLAFSLPLGHAGLLWHGSAGSGRSAGR